MCPWAWSLEHNLYPFCWRTAGLWTVTPHTTPLTVGRLSQGLLSCLVCYLKQNPQGLSSWVSWFYPQVGELSIICADLPITNKPSNPPTPHLIDKGYSSVWGSLTSFAQAPILISPHQKEAHNVAQSNACRSSPGDGFHFLEPTQQKQQLEWWSK